MEFDPYKILGISNIASLEEIKSSYRSLVKKHHPDKGGDEKKILEIYAAWEVLKDPVNRNLYDQKKTIINKEVKRKDRDIYKSKSSEKDNLLTLWIKLVYQPIDRLMADIINPFPKKIQSLAADPYDEILMENFCQYLEHSKSKMSKIKQIYTSRSTPIPAKSFSLSLYHCFSELEDSLIEFEIYTQGYVDNYLHDGQEMLTKSKKKRLMLKKEKNNLPIQ
ncbi:MULTISPECIES: J domain-containing protein [Prochlorococcus]|uniref:J domain-containing protein n=1 Tax=Prochlorococcus TaxID=1218 RepID=UPI0005338979|nr:MULTISPECIES: DnaJ domain-containing protein [Prochlorococcus]KGG13253.1 putative heat shock protein DnaJ [Prochlorococcus sp. MIT 0601]